MVYIIGTHMFMLWYVDAHINFELWNEYMADEIVAYQSKNYDIDYGP
jgi:hypothetical protein